MGPLSGVALPTPIIGRFDPRADSAAALAGILLIPAPSWRESLDSFYLDCACDSCHAFSFCNGTVRVVACSLFVSPFVDGLVLQTVHFTSSAFADFSLLYDNVV